MNQAITIVDKATLVTLLDNADLKAKFAKVLPKGTNVDKFLISIYFACEKTPKLYDCTQVSILKAAMQAAELGLDCSGAMGRAYMIPYKNTAKLIVGFQGYMELAFRSGKIKKISARVVYEGDEFDLDYGQDTIMHRPGFVEGAEIRGAYARAELESGGAAIEYMSVHEIIKIRNKVYEWEKTPWNDHFDEMCRKTVVRRLAKYLPMSSSEPLARAMVIDDEQYEVSDAAQAALPKVQPETRTEKIAKQLPPRTKTAVRGKSTPAPEVIDQPDLPEPEPTPPDDTPDEDDVVNEDAAFLK